MKFKDKVSITITWKLAWRRYLKWNQQKKSAIYSESDMFLFNMSKE